MDPKLQAIKARLSLLETNFNARVGDGTFNIYKLNGESELGEPYEYNITFISPNRLKVEELVDTDVKIELQDELKRTEQRVILGKIFKAQEESIIADKYLYTLKVVHPLYYLKTTKRYEIYQELSAMEIINQIVKQYAGLLDLEFMSSAPPRKKREYTTQYHQSDLEFISSSEEKRVYGVFDGVKLPNLWMELEDGSLTYDMLFKEKKRRDELFKVAPYLVELNFEEKSLSETKKLFEAYGENLFIVFVSSLTFEQSLEKMRGIFHIESGDGERGYFRFYNPSIFTELIKYNDYSLVSGIFHDTHAYFLEHIKENNALMKYWAKDDNIYQKQLIKGLVNEN